MKFIIVTIIVAICLCSCLAFDEEFKKACEQWNTRRNFYSFYYHQTCYIQNRTRNNYDGQMRNCNIFKGGHLIFMFDDDLIDLVFRHMSHGNYYAGAVERNATVETGLGKKCTQFNPRNYRLREKNWYIYDVNTDRHWKLLPKYNCDNFFRWGGDHPCAYWHPNVNNVNQVNIYGTGASARKLNYHCFPDSQPGQMNPWYGNNEDGPSTRWGCICEYRSPMQSYKLAYEGVKLHRLNQILEDSPVYNVDLTGCALTCRKLPVCYSFAYNHYMKVCELYWFSDGHTFFKTKQKPAFGYSLYTLF